MIDTTPLLKNNEDGELPIECDGLLCKKRFRSPVMVTIKDQEYLLAIVDDEPYIYKASIDLLRLIRISGIRIQYDVSINLLADDFKFKGCVN